MGIRLLRDLLRAARRIPQYNMRSYIHRRVMDSFRADPPSSSLTDRASRLAAGRDQLELIRRQALVYSMYSSPTSKASWKPPPCPPCPPPCPPRNLHQVFLGALLHETPLLLLLY